MVSAFTVTASTLISPRLFKEFEIETGKSTWLLGLAGITEGAIPMAIEDPVRVIGSFVLGSMATGAMVGAMNIGLSTPGAGIFSLFLLHDAGYGGVLAAAGRLVRCGAGGNRYLNAGFAALATLCGEAG